MVTVLIELPRLTIYMLYSVKILLRDEKNKGGILYSKCTILNNDPPVYLALIYLQYLRHLLLERKSYHVCVLEYIHCIYLHFFHFIYTSKANNSIISPVDHVTYKPLSYKELNFGFAGICWMDTDQN
jgi:hypothetical protein